jgi:hypothetical protein
MVDIVACAYNKQLNTRILYLFPHFSRITYLSYFSPSVLISFLPTNFLFPCSLLPSVSLYSSCSVFREAGSWRKVIFTKTIMAKLWTVRWTEHVDLRR